MYCLIFQLLHIELNILFERYIDDTDCIFYVNYVKFWHKFHMLVARNMQIQVIQRVNVTGNLLLNKFNYLIPLYSDEFMFIN